MWCMGDKCAELCVRMQRKTWCFVNSSQRPCSNNVAKRLKIENTKQNVRRVEGTDIVCSFFLVWFSGQVVSCVEETRVVRKEDPRSPHTLLHISNKSDESLGAYLFSKYATTCFPSKGPPTSTCFHTPITLLLVVHPPQPQLPQPHHTTEQHKRKTKWK